MQVKLFVGNLPWSVGDAELDQIFSAHGTVHSARVINDRDTGRSRGFGFVEMAEDSEASSAIAALNGRDSGGRPLTVNEARPKVERGDRGGRGGSRQSRWSAPPSDRPHPAARHVACGIA